MVKVYAFDRDDTVETSEGPVPLSEIAKVVARGDIAYCVGNPKLCDEADIPRAPGAEKEEKLDHIRSKHPDADEYIVVDDVEIHAEGWRHIFPGDFSSARSLGS